MKVWAISLCYNDARVIRASLEQYRRTASPDVQTIHVLVDQHWPIKQAETSQELRKLASELNAVFLDPGKNLGLARGFNWALSQLQIPENAGVVGYDPDSWPVDQGWDMAMCQKIVSDPKIGWVSLWHPHAQRELITDHRGDLGHDFVLVKAAVMNSVCMFRMEFLRKVGGLYEKNPLYGGLESHMWLKLKDNGFKWIFLTKFREEFWPYPEMLNADYRKWKWETTHGGKPQIEFGEWLKQSQRT